MSHFDLSLSSIISGSLTWPGCFESVTWIVFNRYQQILNTYLETLFRHTLRFMNNRRTVVSTSSAHRNVRTNIGLSQWFRSPSDDCVPMNTLLEYNSTSSSCPSFHFSSPLVIFVLVNKDLDNVRLH